MKYETEDVAFMVELNGMKSNRYHFRRLQRRRSWKFDEYLTDESGLSDVEFLRHFRMSRPQWLWKQAENATHLSFSEILEPALVRRKGYDRQLHQQNDPCNSLIEMAGCGRAR